MKYFEIILKILYLVCAVYLIYTLSLAGGDLGFQLYLYSPFLVLSFVLGIVLFFNKKQSYGYELSSGEISMRKVEGILLVIFSVAAAACLIYNFFNSVTLIS